MRKKDSLTRAISLILCLLLMLPTAAFAQQSAVDYSGHWAEKQINSFLQKGFISLYKDGTFKPDSSITRAEYAEMANKAFGFTEKDNTNFKDVKTEDAFYNDMAIAKKAGYLTGLPDGTVKPSGYMTRQEYAVIISRLLKLDVKKDIAAADKFKDAAKIPSWSKGSIGAAVKLGYMQGNPDNTFGPEGSITRGQAVAVLERCYLDNIKVSYDKAGTYSAGNVEGSISINAPDVTLENTVVAGNLIIGEGVGSGNAKLKGVIVKGDTIVRGGGLNSIIIEDCQFKNIIVIKADGKVRIVAVGKTTVEKVDMQSGGKLEEQDATGNGFGYVTIAGGVDPEEPIILQGAFESVQVLADNANIDVAAGSIGKLEVAKQAENARINLSSGVTVANMLLDAAATVTGAGKIGTAQVNTQGAVIAAPATNINTAPGVTVSKTVPGTPTTPAPTPAPTAPSTGGGGSGGGGGSNGGGNNNKPSITINSIPAQVVNIGSSVNVTVASVPADAVKSAVSSNTSVATVSVSGNTLKVTGVSAGESTVTVTCSKSGYSSASTTFKVNVSAAVTPTADMALALTKPAAGGGNSINVGGATKTGTVKVVNGTSSVVLTGTKTAAQTVTISGADAAAVTTAGIATAPTYTVNTGDIAATGGIKEFTLTVSETGKSSITYNIKVAVTGLAPAEPLEQVGKPVLSAAGIAAWTDVADEEGYSVQLYKDGAVQGVAVTGAANQTSYDFSSVMKAIGAGLYTVKVTAIGDGVTYQDGPQSESSNGITQLASVASGLIWSGDVAHWTGVAGADSYDVHLYKDGALSNTVNIPAANAAAGADFSADMTENGTYTFKVVAKGDGSTKADAEISKASNEYVKETPTSDMGLELTKPAAGEGNSINVGGAVKSGMVKVVNGTSSVVLTGAKTAAQTVAVSGANATAVTPGGIATAPTYTVNTGDIAVTGGIKEFTLTVSETGKSSITYNIKVTVAGTTPAEPLAQVEDVKLSSAGIATWTDVTDEEGYSVQLYKGETVQGEDVKLSADTTSYNFSEAMRAGGAAVYKVKVTATGDGVIYQDGPQSEASNGITQLAAVTEGLVWAGDVAHWTEVDDADSYTVSLYKDGALSDTVNIPAANASAGADFSADMTEDGTYTFKVAAKGDGTTEADAEMSPASAARVKDTAADRADLEDDKAALVIDLGANSALNNITTALGELPTLLEKGTTVVWTSSKPGVVSDDGQTVTRPGWEDEDETVTMTATLTNGSATGTKTFKLVVKKEGTDQQKLDADKAALKIPLGSNTMEDRIRYSLDPLPASLPYGTTVAWESSDTSTMGNDGKISARPAADTEVTMTAKLTNGSATGEKSFELTVRMKRPNSLTTPNPVTLYKEGNAQWYNISNEIGYIVRLYKGEYALDKNKYVVVARHLAADETTTDFRNDMLDEGPGGYFVSAQGIGDYVNYEDGSAYESQVITLLESPENLHWDGKVAHWSSVVNAEEYQIKLYRDGMVELGTGRTVTEANIAAGVDYTAEIEAGIGGVYTFRIFAKSSKPRVADSGEVESGGIVKLSQTAYMALELISPTGTGNTIGVGGSVKTGTVNLVNGTTSVELKGTKTAAQSVTIGGMNAGSVTIGGDATAPTFTINTADISAGGNKVFTLTVREEGYSDVVYNITVAVTAEQPKFKEDGVVSWEDTAYETGYSVQLYMDDSKYGDAIIAAPDTTSYDFSTIMDEISKLEDKYGDSTTHNIKVAVTALGDGESYVDGPTVESNVVEQLATLELAYFETSGPDKGKLVLTRPLDYKYEVELYKAEESAPNERKLVATTDVYGSSNRNAVKVDFYMQMKKYGDGMYYAGIKAVNNYSSNIQRASLICKPAGESDGGYKCETTADLGLTLNSPNPDANNFITDLGTGIIIVDVASGTQSVTLLGTRTSGQELTAGGDTGKLTYPIVSDEVVTLKMNTSSLFNNRLALNVTVTELGKISRTYGITVIVAPSTIESLVVTSEDDDNSDDKTVIKASGTATAENERVYKNFGKGEVVLPVFDEVVSDGWTVFPGNGIITAANGDGIAVVERRIGTNKAKKAGKTIAVVETEADVAAPSFEAGYPKADNITATGLTLFASLNEAGTVYYAVYGDGEIAPTTIELKTIGNEVDIPAASSEVSIEINGLQAGTAYDIYVIAEDRKGNLQADVKLVEVTTLD